MTLDRPQRLPTNAPIGSLLKAHALPQPRPVSRQGADRDPDYRAMIQACPCVKCGLDPCGTAAHLRMNSGAHGKRQAFGRKPSDALCTPLCHSCHLTDPDAQHKMGEAAFWDRLGIDPFFLCQRLYAQRGDLVAMRAVVFVAIAERECGDAAVRRGERT